MFFKRRKPSQQLGIEALEDRSVPATFTVMNLNDDGAGSLRDAIAQANGAAGSDVIEFQAGLNGTINLTTGNIIVSEAVALNGPGANVITVSGNNASAIFTVLAGGSDLIEIHNLRFTAANGSVISTGIDDQLLITDSIFEGNVGGTPVHALGSSSVIVERSQFINNTSTGSGGGLFAAADVVRLSDVSFVGNHAGAAGGGASINADQSVLIERANFQSNTGDFWGGGLALSSGGTMTIVDSTFVGNSTPGSGGGIDLTGDGTASFQRLRFLNNTADGNGGGVDLFTGTVSIIDSTFDGNVSNASGGGLYAGDITYVSGSTFSNNRANNSGGGIFTGLISTFTMVNSTVTLNTLTDTDGVGGGISIHDTANIFNSTIAENSAPRKAGGIEVFLGNTLNIYSTIVTDNTVAQPTSDSPDLTGAFVSGGGNLFGSQGTLESPILATDFRADTADLGPLQDNGGLTLTRLPGGQASGRGINPLGLTTDQRGAGFPRADGRVDIGAVEYSSGANNPFANYQSNSTFGLIANDQTQGPIESFLQAVYRKLLGRDPDAVGLATWGQMLTEGVSRQEIVRGIWESKEHRSLMAAGIFFDVVGLDPTQADVTLIATKLFEGASFEEAVREAFSSATFTLVNGDTDGFLEALYLNALGREISDAEKQVWLDQLLLQKIHTGTVVEQVIGSTEFRVRIVDILYAGILERGAESPTGREAYEAHLADGATVDEVAIELLSSDEFFLTSGGRLV